MSDLLSSSSDAILAQRGPYALFDAWFAEAGAAEPNDANAMSLATATPAGRPSVRIVLMKGYDAQGFTFYTNFESRKGLELLENPQAMINFHWKSLKRQVRAEGTISVVGDDEADAYFESRPRDSRVGAWASAQSRPLDSRATLEQAVVQAAARFEGGPVPRPPHWSGFRLTPSVIEFWQDRPFRLHDRVVFTTLGGDAWKVHRLYP